MDYTQSPSFVTHEATGQRMHKEVQAVPTAVGEKDLNSLIWSVMEVVKAGGLAGVQFDPDTPTSYQVFLTAIQTLITNSANAILAQLPALSEASLRTGDMIFTSGGQTRPGAIKGNGLLLPRDTFARLYEYASADGLVSEAAWAAGSFGRYSVGDGATTFRVPDYRAMVLRALDDGRGIDVGRLRGVFQAAQGLRHQHDGVTELAGLHTHAGMDEAGFDVTGSGEGGGFRVAYGDNVPYNNTPPLSMLSGNHGHPFTTSLVGGADMRVDNIATPFLIKY
jgi:hypothetical protein